MNKSRRVALIFIIAGNAGIELSLIGKSRVKQVQGVINSACLVNLWSPQSQGVTEN